MTQTFEAEHASLVIHEMEYIDCPKRVRRQYRTVVQISTLVAATPLILILFAFILHVPILPLILILALVAVIRLFEAPMTRAATRYIWPIHVAWLKRRAPGSLVVKRIKQIDVHKKPAAVRLDTETGDLQVGARTRSLNKHHTLALERCDTLKALRLCFLHQGSAPVVVAAPLPDAVREAYAAELEALPRFEGDSVLMDWVAFCAFVGDLREVNSAVETPWPTLLERLLADYVAGAAAVAVDVDVDAMKVTAPP